MKANTLLNSKYVLNLKLIPVIQKVLSKELRESRITKLQSNNSILYKSFNHECIPNDKAINSDFLKLVHNSFCLKFAEEKRCKYA